jgi:hypothetical protein
LVVRDRPALARFDQIVSEVACEANRGTVIWLLAQPARTARKYRHPESLIWRDAGILIGTIALVAEALGVACTPLGPTGEPWLSRALGAQGCLAGLGGVLLGRR